MDEYTFKDLIVDPENPSLESLVGKEVYCSNVPLHCLNYANKNYSIGILKDVRKDADHPFRVETPEGDALWFACIIPKKEDPKPEYIPFESMKDFVERYTEVKEGVDFNSFEDNLLQCGMWLKNVDDNGKPVYILVCEIKDEGVKLDEHGWFNWEELLSKGFLFPNDMPCGKLVEVEHE